MTEQEPDLRVQAEIVPFDAVPPQLASEKVVIAAPMSFAGSATRIWKLVKMADGTPIKIALGAFAVLLIVFAWTLILGWYVVWGLWLVPYRLIRRGSRKRKRQALQHRETLDAIEKSQRP